MVAKYIIFQVTTVGHVSFHALVFSQFFKHSQMANLKIGVPVNAGFCTINPGGVTVWGGSNGLGVTAGMEDAHIIEKQIKQQPA